MNRDELIAMARERGDYDKERSFAENFDDRRETEENARAIIAQCLVEFRGEGAITDNLTNRIVACLAEVGILDD